VQTIEHVYHNIDQNYGTHLSPVAHTLGIIQKYPPGILNPAFTGMFLWDFSNTDNLNEYKISKFHSIKSGIIVYGNEIFVFTPISNNDMQSYLKILFIGVSFKNDLTKSTATRLIVKYIRVNSKKRIIPCIPSIQKSLFDIIGNSEQTFNHDNRTYLTLLHRIYIFMYMLHYNMPLQRKTSPGKRNVASSVDSVKGKGWYSYLSRREQKVLNTDTMFVSSNSIPDDRINGVSINDITKQSKISYHDHQNCSMFRDGSVNCMTFQQEIKKYAYEYYTTKSTSKFNLPIEPTPAYGAQQLFEKSIEEVPDIL